MKSDKIPEIFERCLRASGFERHDTDGVLVERELLNEKGESWVIVAAGILKKEADRMFKGNKTRAERAQIPLKVMDKGEANLLFVMRPIGEIDFSKPATAFAPGDDIPFVELKTGYFRIQNLPDNHEKLDTLRWEWDNEQSRKPPSESWLKEWKDVLAYNPAHPPSHLHINPPKESPRKAYTDAQLRLAVGIPNPISFILSLSVWLKNYR